jgi:hypothetical protein
VVRARVLAMVPQKTMPSIAALDHSVIILLVKLVGIPVAIQQQKMNVHQVNGHARFIYIYI